MNSKTAKKFIFLFIALLVLPIGVWGSKNAVKLFPKAFGTKADLVVDMSTDFGVSTDPWRYLAQGGEEKGRMLAPVIEDVKKLKPIYIRIDHVFDFYTQEELDKVINDIVLTGAKPFVSLSYTPVNLSRGGDITSLPSDWSAWEGLVQKTIERISGTNGLNIDGVYYEVWNEPDLFGKFKTYGEKNYLDLYYHSVLGAQRAQNVRPFKIGGPATTGFYPNWAKSLLKFVSQNSLRFDFLSWHRYSKSLSDYEDDVLEAGKILRDYGKSDSELIISESGPNSENDPVYDTNFSALHLIAVSAVLQDKISKNFSFEIKDGPGNEKYWGRWGMFTHEKFGTPSEKPRAKAVSFLNLVSGGRKLNVYGQGTWVKSFAKKIDDRVIRVLVVNYDPKSINGELVPIKFSNLGNRTFSVKKINFLGGTEKIEENISATDGTWSMNEYLEPNSAVIVEVVFN